MDAMIFFTRKVRRKRGGNFTFLICTDRPRRAGHPDL